MAPGRTGGASLDAPAISFGDIRDDETAMRKVLAMLAYKAARARVNPADFFTFVLREEHTRKEMELAPHQKVLFDFVMYHPMCVLMLPVGHSKTFCMASLAMYLLGRNPSMRGVIVSAAQEQSEKPLKMVREYIEQSAELKMVFPGMRKSPYEGHSWTQTALTVERPMGIKDHSLSAVGEGSKVVMGSRYNFVLVDDILNQDNTLSQEQRQKTFAWFDSSILSRLDPVGSRVVVTNTAWHPRDLVHELRDMPLDPLTGRMRAWPTLKMSATGEIRIYNSDFGCAGRPGAADLRDGIPYNPNDVDLDRYHCRLTAHDPDPNNEQTLFPLRFPKDALELIRLRHKPLEFARAYMNDCRSDADSFCKKEWIQTAKLKGEGMPSYTSYPGGLSTFTGVDLAVSKREGADYTAFFTFTILTNGMRLLLDVDIGCFDAPTIIAKMRAKNLSVWLDDHR